MWTGPDCKGEGRKTDRPDKGQAGQGTGRTRDRPDKGPAGQHGFARDLPSVASGCVRSTPRPEPSRSELPSDRQDFSDS